MPLSGLPLIIQRTLVEIAFKLLRVVFVVIQRIFWELNGTAKKIREARDPKNYERCAQVLDIVLFHKFCWLQSAWLSDYICTHNRFENPQYIIDNEHVTLMTFTDEVAVFVEAKEKGMQLWRSKFSPFIRMGQWEYCNKLIIIPLYAFHRTAEIIGDPKGQLILLFNSARSGSTLVTQIMECTGRCAAISEPDSPNLIASKYLAEGDSPQLRHMARDILRWQCRPYPSIQPPLLAYMIKITAPQVAGFPLFWAIYQSTRCIYIYRDTLVVAKSLARISYSFPSMRLAYLLGRLSGRITEMMVNSMGLAGTEYRIRARDDLTIGIVTNSITAKAYLNMHKQGFKVAAMRYEDLVARPLETCRAMLEFCGLPVSLAEAGLKGFECDSQRNSPIAKSIIGKYKEPELLPESKVELDALLKKFGLPPIGEEEIYEGTISTER